MTESAAGPRHGANHPGLCAACRHARVVDTERSRFWLCRLSFVDPRFAKYPRLPVVRCSGYEPVDPATERPATEAPPAAEPGDTPRS